MDWEKYSFSNFRFYFSTFIITSVEEEKKLNRLSFWRARLSAHSNCSVSQPTTSPRNKNKCRHTLNGRTDGTSGRSLVHSLLITFPTSLYDFTSFDMDLILIKIYTFYNIFLLLVRFFKFSRVRAAVASNSDNAIYNKPTWQMGSVSWNTVDVFLHSPSILIGFSGVSDVSFGAPLQTRCVSIQVFITMPLLISVWSSTRYVIMIRLTVRPVKMCAANEGRKNNNNYYYATNLICDTFHTFSEQRNKQWDCFVLVAHHIACTHSPKCRERESKPSTYSQIIENASN